MSRPLARGILTGFVEEVPNEQSDAVTVPAWGGAGHSQHPHHASGPDVALFKETAPAAVSTTKGKPAQAPKAAKKPAQAPKNEAANPGSGKPKQTSKAIETSRNAKRSGSNRLSQSEDSEAEW